MISIRCANKSDLAQIHALETLAFPDPWSEMGLAEELELPQAYYYVAVKDKKVIGYAGFWNIYNEAEIMKVCVDTEHRRRHVGTRLISALCKKAKALGADTILLEVRKSNTAARALYEAEGFSEYGIRKNYYQQSEDAVLYRRSL